MNLDESTMLSVHGYREGSAEAADPADAARAIAYKRDVARTYIPLTPEQIDFRLGGTEFIVTRKYDGEMNVLFFDGQQAAIINRSGRVRTGLACVEDAAAALRAAGVKQAVVPSELYLDETDGRTRVFQVMGALADESRTGALRLAPFDLLELDGAAFSPGSYADTHAALTRLFAAAALVAPVQAKPCRTKAEVKDVYAAWVEQEGAEGLVVRTELPLVFKIKPRHTLDVAVVGYSESADDPDAVRTLLLALMPAPGEYQIIGRTGNGFGEDIKRDLLRTLSGLTVESSYIEADSNRVAFHMVRPQMVIELLVNDVLFDTLTGYIENPVLAFEHDRFVHKASVRGISVVSPVFVRVREDKTATAEDVRLSQIDDLAYVAPAALAASTALPASDLLRREVYVKEAGAKLMVLKFMAWRTNKPGPVFPAYVFHLTNYSSDRKDPLQREVAISDDEAQIRAIFDASVEANVKRGWVRVEA
ncbi:MAG: hypothetical protein FWC46_08765 [Actinomycetia bacterium]|nr:hypothetical protein [Actinomycetes bacterium]